VIFLLIVLVHATRGGDLSDPIGLIMRFVFSVPGLIVGVTIHEFAHAKAADALGDPTPRAQGRVTLNPLKHFDPVGLGALIIMGFGWGKAVQISPAYFRDRRLGGFIVGIAGVTANFIAAFAFTGAAMIFARHTMVFSGDPSTVVSILFQIVQINLALMIFNLLPVPPLDGFNVLTEIFDLRRYRAWYTIYNYGFPILMVLILLGVTGRVISPALLSVYHFIAGFWMAALS
jgi:Zn-dependent protease